MHLSSWDSGFALAWRKKIAACLNAFVLAVVMFPENLIIKRFNLVNLIKTNERGLIKMDVNEIVLQMIGNTPMVKINAPEAL